MGGWPWGRRAPRGAGRAHLQRRRLQRHWRGLGLGLRGRGLGLCLLRGEVRGLCAGARGAMQARMQAWCTLLRATARAVFARVDRVCRGAATGAGDGAGDGAGEGAGEVAGEGAGEGLGGSPAGAANWLPIAKAFAIAAGRWVCRQTCRRQQRRFGGRGAGAMPRPHRALPHSQNGAPALHAVQPAGAGAGPGPDIRRQRGVPCA